MPRAEERFELVRMLGRGGMGHVELVRDRASGELLARKRLHRLDAARIRALKHELRVAGRLVHPNLVRVYELGEDASGPFLLMEAIDGVDMVSRCTRDGADARAELAALVPQLVAALRFLHRRGVAHGDLSPANVLVRRDGVVKLLDFGLSAAAGEVPRTAGGTPGYLAPERSAGAPPTPEADLYGLGALVHRVIRGAAPEEGALAGDGAVERTIRALLDPRAEARPTLDDLERDWLPALGAPSPASAPPTPNARLHRDALAARVFGTLLARPRHLVVLRGPSGIGKTWLAREVAARAAQAGASVSWSRAHPELRVAFNAIDGLVDDAAERLASSPVPPLLGEAARRASTTFPVLASLTGLDPHAERVRASVRAELFGRASAPPPSRQALFADVRRVLEAVDPRAPMRLLVLDDLHWADGDSLAFLSSLLDTSERSTLLATMRDRAPPALSAWLEARGVASIDVPPAPLEDVVAWLAASEGFDASSAARVARACGGLPALVELALHAPGSVEPLGDAVRAVVRDGSPEEKQALALLLVADTALSLDELGVSRRAVDVLIRRGLVAGWGATLERFDLVHDALRDSLREALGADWLRAAHARRADALAQGALSAERVRHLVGAAENERAAALAGEAAEDAARAQAHDLAAELYGIALAANGGTGEHRSRRSLERSRAQALQRAMRFDEAASAWAGLVASSDPRERSELLHALAHALLAARRIGEGRTALDAALRAAGEPGLGAGRWHALSTITRFVLGPRRLPQARVPKPAQAAQYLRSAPIAGYFDTVTGLDLLLRARESFDRAGAHEQAAWCDFILAFFARFGHPLGASLSSRYRRAAERRLTGGLAERPLVRALPTFLDAYDALRDARYAHAVPLFDRALAMIDGTGEQRSFEAQLTTSLRTSAVLATQDVDAAEAALARFEALARDGVDVAIQCHVENARALVWTWRGRFEEAVLAMELLRSSWPREPTTIQSILIETYAALPDVLLGNAARARVRLAAALDAGRRFRIFGTAYGPIVAGIAALTELAAERLRAGGPRRDRLDATRGWAHLAASRPSVMSGLGHRVLAYLDELEGRPARALARLLDARREAERLGQPIDAALARFARGARLGRSELGAAARGELAAVGASARLLDETRVADLRAR